MEKPPHVERMEAELTELSDRLTKLSAFIGGNEVFATLPETAKRSRSVSVTQC